MMHSHVQSQTVVLDKTLTTHTAYEPLVITVYPHVVSKGLLPRICLLANLALVHSLPKVFYHVFLHVCLREKLLFAHRARKILLFDMYFLEMDLHFTHYLKSLRANRTFEQLHVYVVAFMMMLLPLIVIRERFRAIETSEDLAYIVDFGFVVVFLG